MTIRTSRVHPTVAIVAAALTLGTATACGTDSTAASENTVTISNCGADVAYPQPLGRLFVNDGGMIEEFRQEGRPWVARNRTGLSGQRFAGDFRIARTRSSFELAAKRLSADVVNFAASGSSVEKGESLKDTILTLGAQRGDAVRVVFRSLHDLEAALARVEADEERVVARREIRGHAQLVAIDDDVALAPHAHRVATTDRLVLAVEALPVAVDVEERLVAAGHARDAVPVPRDREGLAGSDAVAIG